MSYKISKHEYDLLKKLSGMFYDEYDDRIRLGWDHVIRELPNGVKDGISDDGFTQNLSDDVILNGNSSWFEYSAFENTYAGGIAHGLTNAIFNTIGSAIGYCDDGNYISINSPSFDTRNIYIDSNGYYYLHIEKEKVDVMEGATTLDKFKAYLNIYPITLIYQLAVPVDIPLPENMDPNTLEIVRLSEKLDQLTASFIAGGGTMI